MIKVFPIVELNNYEKMKKLFYLLFAWLSE